MRPDVETSKKTAIINRQVKTAVSSLSVIVQRIVLVLFVDSLRCASQWQATGTQAKNNSTSNRNSSELSLGLIHHTVFASAEQLQEISRNTDRRADYGPADSALNANAGFD